MAYISERSPDIINPTAPIDDGRDPSMQPDSAKYTVYAAEVEAIVRGIAEELWDARNGKADLPTALAQSAVFIHWDGTGTQPERTQATDDLNQLVIWCQPTEPPAMSGLNVWFRIPA